MVGNYITRGVEPFGQGEQNSLYFYIYSLKGLLSLLAKQVTIHSISVGPENWLSPRWRFVGTGLCVGTCEPFCRRKQRMFTARNYGLTSERRRQAVYEYEGSSSTETSMARTHRIIQCPYLDPPADCFDWTVFYTLRTPKILGGNNSCCSGFFQCPCPVVCFWCQGILALSWHGGRGAA